MAEPPPDPHVDEWKRAVANGRYESRRGLVVAAASSLSAIGVLAAWIYGYHDQVYVYAGSGRDASWEIMKRGILLAGLVGVVVAIVLIRVLGVRENAYTKGLSSLIKR
jgi:hypothetical protein